MSDADFLARIEREPQPVASAPGSRWQSPQYRPRRRSVEGDGRSVGPVSRLSLAPRFSIKSTRRSTVCRRRAEYRTSIYPGCNDTTSNGEAGHPAQQPRVAPPASIRLQTRIRCLKTTARVLNVGSASQESRSYSLLRAAITAWAEA